MKTLVVKSLPCDDMTMMVAREQLNEAIGLPSTFTNYPAAVTWVSEKMGQRLYLHVDNDMHLTGAHTPTVEADR